MSDHNGSDNTREKLERALRQKAILSERSRLLQQQVEDFRSRETSMNHIASELLQRQRELNYMLHRASSVLHQMQDTNLALSAEFTHLVKELPAPREGEAATSEWEETMSRVNDLFRRTHELAGEMQDEIFRSAGSGPIDPSRDIAAVSITGGVAPQSEPPAQAPAVEIEPLVEQTPAAMHADAVPTIEAEVVEPVHAAPVVEAQPVEEIDSAPIIEAEVVEAPHTHAEPEISSAAIVEPIGQAEPTDEASQDESADDLFSRLNTVSTETDEWQEDGTAVAPPRKPSLLARIFGYGDED